MRSERNHHFQLTERAKQYKSNKSIKLPTLIITALFTAAAGYAHFVILAKIDDLITKNEGGLMAVIDTLAFSQRLSYVECILECLIVSTLIVVHAVNASTTRQK